MRTIRYAFLTALLTMNAGAASVLVLDPAPLTGNNGIAGWGFSLTNDTTSYLSVDSVYLASAVDDPEYRFGAAGNFTAIFSNYQGLAATILIAPKSTYSMAWNGSDQGLASWDFPDGYATYGDFASDIFGIAVNYSLWDDDAYTTATLDGDQMAITGTLYADAQLQFIDNSPPTEAPEPATVLLTLLPLVVWGIKRTTMALLSPAGHSPRRR